MRSLAFTGDGELLVSANGSRGVRVWEVATGEERYALGEGVGSFEAVSLSPGGELIAAATNWAGGTVKLWELPRPGSTGAPIPR